MTPDPNPNPNPNPHPNANPNANPNPDPDPNPDPYPNQEYAHDSEAAKAVQATLEHTTLLTVTNMTEIWFDPIQPADAERATVVEEDEDFVKSYYEVSKP